MFHEQPWLLIFLTNLLHDKRKGELAEDDGFEDSFDVWTPIMLMTPAINIIAHIHKYMYTIYALYPHSFLCAILSVYIPELG